MKPTLFNKTFNTCVSLALLFALSQYSSLKGAENNEDKSITYTLNIAETLLSPAGAKRKALTINGGIPGPVLRFKVGETARILVRNQLKSETTSIHWHGLLVPNLEDGVPLTTTPLIEPGKERLFEFPLTHAGTYWYHSHTGLQEQRGIYGAIVIEDPKQEARMPFDRDEVIILSDWTNESPTEVMRTLMRGSEWYSIRKGTAQSLWGAYKSGHLRDYLAREKSRMPPMDVSDVAYDAFLANGQRSITIPAKPGERIRLRFINAGASTYFYLHSATGPLTIIAADGNDVQPIKQKRLLLGMAETYDLYYTVPESGSWELRATAQDASGYASIFIGQGDQQKEIDMKKINPYSMSDAMDVILNQLNESGNVTDEEALTAEAARPLPPYKRLKAIETTAIDSNAPRRKISVHLTGNMVRYMWSIDGKTMMQESTITIHHGEVVQMELINDTMMHHPMHLHGHFFRLLLPNGAASEFAPLKHTVDVPPMSRRTIEFQANESGDWLFHCHLLYHHKNGMGRVVSYAEQGDDHKPEFEMSKSLYPILDGRLTSNLSDGRLVLMDMRNEYGVQWDVGWDDIDATDEAEFEIDLEWRRFLSMDWSAFIALRTTNKLYAGKGLVKGSGATLELNDQHEVQLVTGAVYLLPYYVALTTSVSSAGELRIGLNKEIQITSRLSMPIDLEYDTASGAEARLALSYLHTKSLATTVIYDSDYGLGAGFEFHF